MGDQCCGGGFDRKRKGCSWIGDIGEYMQEGDVASRKRRQDEPTSRVMKGMLTGRQHIHQMHRDIVYAYPSSVEHLGNTSRCEVQGMYTAKRLITVQGHPEFNGDVVSELLQRRHEQGIFNDEMYEEAMARVRQKHDGVAVGAVFLRFLLEE